jgi:hypothetical protein
VELQAQEAEHTEPEDLQTKAVNLRDLNTVAMLQKEEGSSLYILE